MPARVAELVDALDLGSSGVTRESSSLSFRTRALARFSRLIRRPLRPPGKRPDEFSPEERVTDASLC